MEKSVCFTGHRSIAESGKDLTKRLYKVLEQQIITQGITEYFSGGAVGFDTIAALTVLQLRERYKQIKLHLVLPCSNAEQTYNWIEDQIKAFNHILSLADSVLYTSEKYYKGCMKVRNARLVECASECCVCYYNVNDFRSGTGQTVRMAQRKGIQIINLFI